MQICMRVHVLAPLYQACIHECKVRKLKDLTLLHCDDGLHPFVEQVLIMTFS